MATLRLKSSAKLNLSLRVLGKRSDGYHDLETIFERIDLFDDMIFKSTSNGRIKIHCDHPAVPTGRKNLVHKVASLLQKQFGIESGVDITIKKRIPVAAGLAGGSSNAATTLLGLNKLWNLRLSFKELNAIGAQIGSDVCFFLHETSFALGEGRGERIKPLKISSKFWHVVVVPSVKMYTKLVFGGLNLGLTKKGVDVNILTLALKKGSAEKLGQLLCNDLESSILSIRPRLLRVKQRISKYSVLGVCFSGSGPSVYALVSSEKEALALKKILKRTYTQVFAVRTF